MISISSRAVGSVFIASVIAASTLGCSATNSGFCRSLDESSVLHGLNSALNNLANPNRSSSARNAIHDGANVLRKIGASAPQSIAPDFTNAASALDSLANEGITDVAVVRSADHALTILGSGVQSQCHFSVR